MTALEEWNDIRLNTDHPGVTYIVDAGNAMRDELLAKLAALKAINSSALRVGREAAQEELERLKKQRDRAEQKYDGACHMMQNSRGPDGWEIVYIDGEKSIAAVDWKGRAQVAETERDAAQAANMVANALIKRAEKELDECETARAAAVTLLASKDDEIVQLRRGTLETMTILEGTELQLHKIQGERALAVEAWQFNKQKWERGIDRISEQEAMLRLAWERTFWVASTEQPSFEDWLAELQSAVESRTKHE